MVAKTLVLAMALGMAVAPMAPASAEPIVVCTDELPVEPPPVEPSVIPSECVTIVFQDDGTISIGTGGSTGSKYKVAILGENFVQVCQSNSTTTCVP